MINKKKLNKFIEKVRDAYSSDEAIKKHGNWQKRLAKKEGSKTMAKSTEGTSAKDRKGVKVYSMNECERRKCTYLNFEGKEVSLYTLCRQEPEWAASRMRVMEKTITEQDRKIKALETRLR